MDDEQAIFGEITFVQPLECVAEKELGRHQEEDPPMEKFGDRVILGRR